MFVFNRIAMFIIRRYCLNELNFVRRQHFLIVIPFKCHAPRNDKQRIGYFFTLKIAINNVLMVFSRVSFVRHNLFW